MIPIEVANIADILERRFDTESPNEEHHLYCVGIAWEIYEKLKEAFTIHQGYNELS